MKAFVTLSLTAALSLGLCTGLSAAEKKAKPATPAPAATPDAKKPAAKSETDATKPIPMYVRIDEIDASAKTFSQKRKDGALIKHVVPATAELKNGDKALKFEDLKVGDWVGGLRTKKSPTEYEVIKVTKIGAAPAKRGKAEPKTEAKPEEKKQ